MSDMTNEKPESTRELANEAQSPTIASSSLEDIPDGGLRAWCTVLGGWLALFATFGYASSFGVFQDFYVQRGTSSSSNVSWIGSTSLFFFIAMGLPAGKLVDAGYFKHVIFAGSLLYIFSMFMLSLAHVNKYYQLFLSQGIGMGIGIGLVYVPSIAVQAHHFRERRATALGIVITGSSVGGIVYPIMLNNLFNDSVGFAWGVRASAFLTLGFLIAANLLMTDRVSVNKQKALLKNQLPKDKPRVFTDVPFILAVTGAFFIIWGLFFPYFYLQLFTTLHNLPQKLAFYQLTIQNAASVFGRTIPNVLADKYGSINALIISSVGTGVLVFAMFGIADVGGVIAFSILYGFFSGAVLSLFVPVIVSFATGVHEVGARIGVAYIITCWAFLTGTPISGALFMDGGRWFKPIIFNGTVILAGIPFLLLARHMQVKKRGVWKV